MKIKIIDLVSLSLTIVSWVFLDIPLEVKILTTILFSLLIIIGHLKQELVNDLDLLNFALAEFAWILPEIKIIFKILMCLVLLIVLIFHRAGVIQYQTLSTSKYLLLLMISYLIVYAEFWLSAQIAVLSSPTAKIITQSEIAVSSLVFIIIIGLPLALYGAGGLSKRLKSSFNIFVGCFYQIVLCFLFILFFMVIWNNDALYQQVTEVLGIGWLGIMGPMGILVPSIDSWRPEFLRFIPGMGAIIIVTQHLFLGRKLIKF